MTTQVSEQERYVNTNDPTLLLVKGFVSGDGEKSESSKKEDRDNSNYKYIMKLSLAIVKTIEKHGIAKMRCVGSSSVNNAIAAYINAKGELIKQGKNVILDASYKNISFKDNDRPIRSTLVTVELEDDSVQVTREQDAESE